MALHQCFHDKCIMLDKRFCKSDLEGKKIQEKQNLVQDVEFPFTLNFKSHMVQQKSVKIQLITIKQKKKRTEVL